MRRYRNKFNGGSTSKFTSIVLPVSIATRTVPQILYIEHNFSSLSCALCHAL
jgi:hypothetical protein